MDTRQLTSLLFFNSTQRRNADQEIANLADINNLDKRNTRAIQNMFGAIKY